MQQKITGARGKQKPLLCPRSYLNLCPSPCTSVTCPYTLIISGSQGQWYGRKQTRWPCLEDGKCNHRLVPLALGALVWILTSSPQTLPPEPSLLLSPLPQISALNPAFTSQHSLLSTFPAVDVFSQLEVMIDEPGNSKYRLLYLYQWGIEEGDGDGYLVEESHLIKGIKRCRSPKV
jgi:hypothetical protein